MQSDRRHALEAQKAFAAIAHTLATRVDDTALPTAGAGNAIATDDLTVAREFSRFRCLRFVRLHARERNRRHRLPAP